MENNNLYPEQSTDNGQYAQPGQYTQQYGGQYNQQYAPDYTQQYAGQYNQQSTPQYAYQPPQYTQQYDGQYNQQSAPQYTQQYSQPYTQQYNQTYGYGQSGFTAQKKPLNPVILAIPAAVVPAIAAAIYTLIASNVSNAFVAILGFFLNIFQLAVIGGLGFMAYKKPKGAAVFLGSYFVAGCIACVPTEFIKAIAQNYSASNAMYYVALLIAAILTPVGIMLYEKLQDKTADNTQNPQPVAAPFGSPLQTKNELYNPLFIAVAVFAVTFVNRLAVAITNYHLSTLFGYGRVYIRDAAISSLIINIIAVAMVVGAGFFMSKSFKKCFEFAGYACVASKISIILGAITSAIFSSSNLILNIFLAIVLSLLGAAAALACSLIVEGKKDMKLF